MPTWSGWHFMVMEKSQGRKMRKVLWELQEGRSTSQHGCPEIRQLGAVVWSPETLRSRSALPCLKCGKQETTPCRKNLHPLQREIGDLAKVVFQEVEASDVGNCWDHRRSL